MSSLTLQGLIEFYIKAHSLWPKMMSERKSNGHYRRSTVELQLGAFTVGAFLLSPSVSSWYSFKVRGGQFWKSNLHIVVFCKIALFSWKNLNNLRSKSEKATIKNSDKSYDFKIKEMIFFYPYPSSRCVTVSHLMMLNGAMYPYCSFVLFSSILLTQQGYNYLCP